MKPRHWLFAFLALLTALRLAYIAQIELVPDEAYYFMWSERPDISYYSKGPGVAVAIRIGTALFGPSAFGVRFLSPLLALATALLVFSFTRRLYGESVAIWAVIVMQMVPLFAVGALLMTIDPLSIFFWTAALYSFWLALQRSPAFSLHWPLTGLLIGLGFLCKWTNAIQLVSILAVLATTRRFRAEFARPGLYLLLGVFALCTIPPILWNARHEWITLAHLTARGGLNKEFRFDPAALPVFILTHFGVYSPLIFLGFMIALWWGFRTVGSQFKPRFLLWFSAPLLLLYGVLSLRETGEANWTVPAFVSLAILATALWHERARVRRGAAIFASAALALGLAMTLLTLDFDLIRAAGIPLSYRNDPSARLRGWKSSAGAVAEARKRFEQETGAPVFLIANKYQTAAALSFYLPDPRIEGPGHPAVYIPESQDIQNQFSFWPRYEEVLDIPAAGAVKDAYYTEEHGVNPFLGRNALYITDRAELNAPSTIKNAFGKVQMIEVIQITRRGWPLRELRVFACYDYRTMSL